MEQRLSDAQIESQIIEIIGVKYAGILKNNTPSRICGLLSAKGRNDEWEHALEHIGDHFRPMPGKPSHSIFSKRFRDSDALKELVKRAVSAPSTTRLSRLTLPARGPVGAPCMLIMRNFKQQIGIDADQTCLVVVADFQGKLVSAYPTTKNEAGLT
jgi:hypothetical protein